MRGKPFLEIEIDEHSADVGAITRLEAFLDSLKNVVPQTQAESRKSITVRVANPKRRKVFLPPMTDHALGLVAAFQACGTDAELLPQSDAETLIWGRRLTSGKECYPLILTTGDMVKMTQRPDFDPANSAFFMPSGDGPCRFGQYNRLQRLFLDEMGFPEVPIIAPDQTETLYQDVGLVGGVFPASPGREWWPLICWRKRYGKPGLMSVILAKRIKSMPSICNGCMRPCGTGATWRQP